MPKILPVLGVLAATAFLALPLPANAAPQSQGGAETDHSATVATDISSHRRRYRHRHRGHYRGAYWAPRPYYGYGYYRPYRYGYWGGPRIFPFGPFW